MKPLKFILSSLLLVFSLTGNSQQSPLFKGSFLGTPGVEESFGIALYGDKVFLAGTTSDTGFPVTPGLINDTITGSYDVFLACFDTSGNLIWSTLIGGSNYELGPRLAIDHNQNLIVSGYTYSTDFPVTTGAWQSNSAGSLDCFLFKTDSTGHLIWSTYHGGTAGDLGIDLSVDTAGNIFLGGQTTSTDFPVTTGAFQTTLSGGVDAFLSKFSPAGIPLWSTYFGGADPEDIHAVSTDKAGNIVVSGMTSSNNLPTSSNAFQNGLNGNVDLYVARFTSSGTISFSTYLGGSNFDDGLGLTTDSTGNIYVSGRSNSNDFPVTPNAWQDTITGGYDAILSKFDSSGAFIFSTFLGGLMDDNAARVRASEDGLSLLVTTQNDSLPSFGPSLFPAGNGSSQQVWLLKFSTEMDRKYSTYFNGTSTDIASELFVLDTFVVFCGTTYSPSLPFSNTNPYQSIHQGQEDTFWALFGFKIAETDTTPPIDTSAIKSYSIKTEFTAYPNPFSDQFRIKSHEEIEEIEIFDLSGRLAETFHPKKVYTPVNLKAGTYILRVRFRSGITRSELLIKK